MEIVVSSRVAHPNFDDQHLVALLIISGCKLICSLDERAYLFFKHKEFFEKASKRPKIFKGTKQNKNLLNDKNITGICKLC